MSLYKPVLALVHGEDMEWYKKLSARLGEAVITLPRDWKHGRAFLYAVKRASDDLATNPFAHLARGAKYSLKRGENGNE